MVDIAKSIFSKVGHTIVYKIKPWKRTIIEVRKGKINGAIGPYIEDCPDFIFPKNELAKIGFNIFVKKDNPWVYNGVSSLEGIRLGVVSGYSYGEKIDSYIAKNKKNSSKIHTNYGNTPLRHNIKKLLAGNSIDAVIATKSVFLYTANKLNVKDQVKSAGIVTKSKEAYIAFSPVLKSSKEYAQILSNGMVELRESGELEKILNKYGLTDWK